MVENVPPRKVWEALQKDPKAQLVDVRTDAEWNFVGLPDLSPATVERMLQSPREFLSLYGDKVPRKG